MRTNTLFLVHLCIAVSVIWQNSCFWMPCIVSEPDRIVTSNVAGLGQLEVVLVQHSSSICNFDPVRCYDRLNLFEPGTLQTCQLQFRQVLPSRLDHIPEI